MPLAEHARPGLALALVLLTVLPGSLFPAHAQISGSVGVASDDRWRGRSLSAGRPVVFATIGYDAPGGAYIDGAATAAWSDDDRIALTGGAIDAGYAWRTANGLAIDIGATRQQFTGDFSGGRETGYSEVYIGLNGRSLAARLSYSPDYFAPGAHVLYAGADAVLSPWTDWRVMAHAGTTIYLSPIRTTGIRSIQYDYSLGVARRFKGLELQLDLSSGGPDPDFYGGHTHSRTALTVRTVFRF